MNFSCDQCRKAYTIADEKVAGRSFRVTCKQCGHVIQVRAPGAPAAAPAVTPAAGDAAAPTGPAAAPAPAAPPAPR